VRVRVCVRVRVRVCVCVCTEMAGACVGVVAFVFFFEGYRVMQASLDDSWANKYAKPVPEGTPLLLNGRSNECVSVQSTRTSCFCAHVMDDVTVRALYPDTTDPVPRGGKAVTVVFPWGIQFVRAFLHTIFFFWAYLIMLVFMIMNGPLCLSCCIGAGLGFLVFHRTSVRSSATGCCD
jgi:hypothetical protein